MKSGPHRKNTRATLKPLAASALALILTAQLATTATAQDGAQNRAPKAVEQTQANEKSETTPVPLPGIESPASPNPDAHPYADSTAPIPDSSESTADPTATPTPTTDPTPETTPKTAAKSRAATTATVATASAAPRVPHEPTVVFHEDFESKAALTPADLSQPNPVLTLSGSAHTYPQYRSQKLDVDGNPLTYTGDTYWMNHNQCNGVVINYLTTESEIWKPKNQSPNDGWKEACNGGLNKKEPASDPGSSTAERIFARNNVRRMAYVLGLVEQNITPQNGVSVPAAPGQQPQTIIYPQGYNQNGSTGHIAYNSARNNDAVTAYSMAEYNTALQAKVFASSKPVDVSGTGNAVARQRFYSMSIDVAELSCTQNVSSLQFILHTGVGTGSLQSTPLVGNAGETIRACTDSRLRHYTAPTDAAAGHNLQEFSNAVHNIWGPWAGNSVWAGRFYSSGSKLISTTQMSRVGFEVRNNTRAHDGNDFAFDNIRILDATPTLYKAFLAQDNLVASPGPVTLAFEVVNSSDLAKKEGWSFTDELPEDLRVAAVPNARVQGQCTATVTAPAGAGSISLTNGVLDTDAERCTVLVDVELKPSAHLTQPGTSKTYTNCPSLAAPASSEDGYLSHINGLNESECASITFYADPELDYSKTARVEGADTDNGDTDSESDDSSPAEVQPEGNVTYTVSFTNTGRDPRSIAHTDDLAGVLDDASFDGQLTVETRKLDQAGEPAEQVPNTVTATWNATTKKVTFAGTLAAQTVAKISYTVRANKLTHSTIEDWGNSSLDNCVRPSDTTEGGKCTKTLVVPPTIIKVTKHELNFDGTPTAADGWEINLTTPALGQSRISPNTAVQQTFTNAATQLEGAVRWQLANSYVDSQETFTLAEKVDSKPGYAAQTFECRVTDLTGNSVTQQTEHHAIQVENVKAGSTVECVVTNAPQSGIVTWHKEDPQGNRLAGSVWAIATTDPNGPDTTQFQEVEDCVADSAQECSTAVDQNPQAGEFTITGLNWGQYILTEVKAPSGYERLESDTPFEISAQALTHDFTQAFVNVLKQPLAIPLTGGTGTAIFTALGSAGTLSAALLLLRRRNRRILHKS